MGNEQPGEDQPEYNWQAVGGTWYEGTYIDASKTRYAVDGKNVAYKIVTLPNGRAQSFTVTMTVGEDKKVGDFAIEVNGSKPESFADKMAAMAELINGKGVDELYAAIYAAANYDVAMGNEVAPQMYESQYIDLTQTRYTVEGDEVKYTVVTLANGRAQSFTITMTVGDGKKVGDFAIVVNGSSPASFADRMAAMAELINGKDVGELKALLKDTAIATGATRSNELCVYAAIFATANYDLIISQGDPQFYTGEYHYSNYGVEYGVSVTVKVAGGKIWGVYINQSDYTQISPANPDYGWSEDSVNNYKNNEAKLLASYIGLPVADVLAMQVGTAENGEPSTVPEGAPTIAGATQSAGRLILAVQNALKTAGYEVVTGEYHYPNTWAPESPEYGIKVNVAVKDGVIVSVTEADSDYVSVTDSWESKDIWLNGLDELLAAYNGRTVEAVLAEKVVISGVGQPDKVENGELMITGATQGSGRLLLAVQNALEKLA